MLLQGLFIPLTCPFYRDGTSYLRKLEHNVGRYSLGPAAGLVALAPGGEAAALTDGEAGEFLKVTAEAASKTKVLLAGVERASVHAALASAEVAAHAGFDAILLAPPLDWARLVRGEDVRPLQLFYSLVADRSPLPVVLWSDAQPPSLPLPEAAILSLAGHPNVLGLADANLDGGRLQAITEGARSVKRQVTVTTVFEAVTRRMEQQQTAVSAVAQSNVVPVEALRGGTAATAAVATAAPPQPALKTRTREVGFQCLSAGYAHAAIPLLEAGATGLMPRLSACAPQACFEALAAWKDGDHALAAERAARLQGPERLLAELGPAAVKTGCDYNGYFGGLPRLPRLPLTAEERTAVEKALATVRN